MKRSRFTQERIIGVLKERAAGAKVAELCRSHGMSDATFDAWKSKYGGMDVSEAKRLRGLAEENAKLKRLLAEAMLDNSALKDLLGEDGDARCEARGCRASSSDVRGERAAGVHGGRREPDDGPLPFGAAARRSAARTVESAGARATAVRLSAAARAAAARRLCLEPQAPLPALPRRNASRCASAAAARGQSGREPRSPCRSGRTSAGRSTLCPTSSPAAGACAS